MALPDGYAWSRTSAWYHFVVRDGVGMVLIVSRAPNEHSWRVYDLLNTLGYFEELHEAKRFCEVTLTLCGS